MQELIDFLKIKNINNKKSIFEKYVWNRKYQKFSESIDLGKRILLLSLN